MARLLEGNGDLTGALDAYRQAIGTRNRLHAGPAMVEMGQLLERQGDLPGARAAYQQAIESGGSSAAAAAIEAMAGGTGYGIGPIRPLPVAEGERTKRRWWRSRLVDAELGHGLRRS